MRNLYFISFLMLFNSCGRDQKKQVIPAEVKQEQEVAENDTAGIPDLLIVDQPSKNAEISSPIRITGKARGSWFFEADFPLEIVNESGKVLVKSYATAQGNWMTDKFVPFSAEVEFEAAGAEKGSLILRRANASGLPENNRSYRLPVTFKK